MQVVRNKNEEYLQRNEASRKFVSLRSHFDSPRPSGPSRVKMNALRTPLTARSVSNERKVVFSLDSADAFIDAGNTPGISALSNPLYGWNYLASTLLATTTSSASALLILFCRLYRASSRRSSTPSLL